MEIHGKRKRYVAMHKKCLIRCAEEGERRKRHKGKTREA